MKLVYLKQTHKQIKASLMIKTTYSIQFQFYKVVPTSEFSTNDYHSAITSIQQTDASVLVLTDQPLNGSRNLTALFYLLAQYTMYQGLL